MSLVRVAPVVFLLEHEKKLLEEEDDPCLAPWPSNLDLFLV